MSLPETRTVLQASARPGADCAPVSAGLFDHCGHGGARIADLPALMVELYAIRAHCAGPRRARACGIVQTLSRPASRRVRKSSHVRGSD
jgi:hypothetical protein